MRTGNDYMDLMKHALGGDADSRLRLLDVINDAIRFIYQSHDWRFKKRPPLDIVFTVGNPQVQLPDDFGELIDVCTKNNAIANVIQTSLQEIAWRRGSPNAVAYDGLYRVALSWPGQSSDQSNEQGIPVLEIWPTPTSTKYPKADLTITYRAGPVELLSLDDVPAIPPTLSRLLVLTCRLFVQGYEEEQIKEDPLWDLEFKAQKDGDGRQQSVIGQIQGGAVQRMRQIQVREFQKIIDPSNRTS